MEASRRSIRSTMSFQEVPASAVKKNLTEYFGKDDKINVDVINTIMTSLLELKQQVTEMSESIRSRESVVPVTPRIDTPSMFGIFVDSPPLTSLHPGPRATSARFDSRLDQSRHLDKFDSQFDNYSHVAQRVSYSFQYSPVISRPTDTSRNVDHNRYEDKPLGWRHMFGGDNNADIEEYIRRFESYAVACNWGERTKTASFISTLQGRASYIVCGLPAGSTWDVVINKLRNEWEPPGRKKVLRKIFATRHRRTKESAEEYLQSLTNLAGRAFGHYPDYIREERVLTCFIDGQPEYIQDAIVSRDFVNVTDALTAVIKAESRRERGETRSDIYMDKLPLNRNGLSREESPGTQYQ
jgi:hypothetical protein